MEPRPGTGRALLWLCKKNSRVWPGDGSIRAAQRSFSNVNSFMTEAVVTLGPTESACGQAPFWESGVSRLFLKVSERLLVAVSTPALL